MQTKFITTVDIYYKSKLQKSKSRFISVRKNYVYICRDGGRVYWNIKYMTTPVKIKFLSKSQKMYIGSLYKIIFKKKSEFNYVMSMLKKYAEIK